jgi:hypothetical protein
MRNHFLHPVHLEKRLGQSRGRHVTSRQIALRTDKLVSESFKMRFWWCRWRDVSWCLNAIRTHFLNCGHSKKLFVRSHESDFEKDEWPYEHVTCLLNVLKKTLLKSLKRWFKVSKGHTITFSASWASKKATWTNSQRWSFKYEVGPENSLSAFWKS